MGSVSFAARAVPKAYRSVLATRDFRRFWTAIGISNAGDSMSEVAVVWLAIELAPANKPVAIALAAAAYFIPGVLTGLLLGRVLEKLDGQRLILIDCAGRFSMLSAIVFLDQLAMLGLPVYIVLLSAAAITRPLGMAGERIMTRDLVRDDQFFAANSLLGFSQQSASVAAPVVAGLLIASVGSATMVIALDAITFAVCGLIILAVRVRAALPESTDNRPGFSVRSLLGLRIVFALLVLTFVFHLLYGPFAVALPLLAQTFASGSDGAGLLGILWSSFGVGTVIGGLLAGTRHRIASPVAAAVIVGLWGIVSIMIGAADSFSVAVIAMAFGGLTYAPYTAITTTVMQRDVPPRMLGRVSGYWSSMTSVASPIGILLGGVIVAVFGVSRTLVGCGAILILASLVSLPVLRQHEADRLADEDLLVPVDHVPSSSSQRNSDL